MSGTLFSSFFFFLTDISQYFNNLQVETYIIETRFISSFYAEAKKFRNLFKIIYLKKLIRYYYELIYL